MNPDETPSRFSPAWLLILWRVAAYPVSGLWQDWVVLATLAWLLSDPARPRARVTTVVAVAAMGILAGRYVQGQLGHVLRILGWGP